MHKFCVHMDHLWILFGLQLSSMCDKLTFVHCSLVRVSQLSLVFLQAFLQLRLEEAVLQRRNCSLCDCLAWGMVCMQVFKV
jgi:hypothetical protein